MGDYTIHTYRVTCECPYCQQIRKEQLQSQRTVLDEKKVNNRKLYQDKRQDAQSNNLITLTNPLTQEPITVGGNTVYVPKQLGPKKRELRGVWITTVRNNDFPSEAVYANGFNLDLFKSEFIAIIRRCKALRLNAIFFQVRPEGDAFYESGVNPWSTYLTGEQGVKPDWGDFDPLTWMIDVTHQAGIEFHAWFNPYRLTPVGGVNSTKQSLLNSLSETHYARRHPDWVYYFNRQIYLDPGVPEVQEFIIQTVMEVAQKYDIDAVHFDDYFRYIFNDFKESKKDVGEKEQLERVNDKKNHLFKTFNECVPQGVSIDRFNSFVGVVLKYIKQNYESIEEDELVWEIKYFCENVFWGDYVTLLKNDLVFNYYMILGLFSSDLMNSSSLDEILTIIRKLFYGNAKKFLGCSREELINLKADYRDFQCVGNDDFWNATPSYDEISASMSALFKKYEMLCCDNDDASYALNSFKLSQELLQIHPFRNGNGRTSKYLLFLLSIKRNILPITMTDGHYLPECYYRMERLRDDKVLADYFRYREDVMQRRFK